MIGKKNTEPTLWHFVGMFFGLKLSILDLFGAMNMSEKGKAIQFYGQRSWGTGDGSLVCF